MHITLHYVTHKNTALCSYLTKIQSMRCAYVYLFLMVDVCFCCNQIFYGLNKPLLAGDIQWRCTILENLIVAILYSPQLYM